MRKVVKVDQDGRVLSEYRSAAEAGRDNNIDANAVRMRCKGRVKHPFVLAGWDFRYKEDADESKRR